MTLLYMPAVYGYMLYYVRYMNLIKFKVVILAIAISLTTALSWFQTVLDYHYHFTLNSIFRPKAIIKKTCTSMSTTRWWNRDYVVDIEVHVFLDKGLWPNY